MSEEANIKEEINAEEEISTQQEQSEENKAAGADKEENGIPDAEETEGTEVKEEAASEENTDETDEESLEESSEEKGEHKKLFKKKDKKDAKDTKIEELTDQVRRQMAEFENFRKRTDKEKSSMYEMGAKSVIEKILPVIDNFERGLSAVPKGEGDSFYEGMQLVYKQMLSELEGIGVKPIEALGQPFDPNLHNAVMQIESEEYESGVIAQELQKGYMYRDTVVRYSMVAVVP